MVQPLQKQAVSYICLVCVCVCVCVCAHACVHVSMHTCIVTQSCPTLWDPMDCSPPGSSVHGDSPCKNTGVGCHAIHLQGIFSTQGSNLDVLHYRQILYRLRGTSHPWNGTGVSWIAWGFFTSWASKESPTFTYNPTFTIQPMNSTPGYLLKRNENKFLCKNVCIISMVVLSIVAKNWR